VAVLAEQESRLSAVQRIAWLMRRHHGCPNPTAESSWRMHYSARLAQRRSPPSRCT
jgi:hypothetical protein